MLLYTKTNDGYRIIATSQGVIVSGPTPELARQLSEKLSKSRYCLYPDKIVFLDEQQDEQHHQNQKTSFWRKLFGY
jgi:hypothetical protein